MVTFQIVKWPSERFHKNKVPLGFTIYSTLQTLFYNIKLPSQDKCGNFVVARRTKIFQVHQHPSQPTRQGVVVGEGSCSSAGSSKLYLKSALCNRLPNRDKRIGNTSKIAFVLLLYQITSNYYHQKHNKFILVFSSA